MQKRSRVVTAAIVKVDFGLTDDLPIRASDGYSAYIVNSDAGNAIIGNGYESYSAHVWRKVSETMGDPYPVLKR